MSSWISQTEQWLTRQYERTLRSGLAAAGVRLRWLSNESLTAEIDRSEAQGLAIEDVDVGWLLFVLPYDKDRLQKQVSQGLGLRSRLLREANYTGNQAASDKEDGNSTWRVGLIWLVNESSWSDWQSDILELRRESGAAEEVSLDAVCVKHDDVSKALDAHGVPRLLLHTRALLSKTSEDAEKWRSADKQVSAELDGFSQQFDAPRARMYARQLEDMRTSFEPNGPPSSLSQARQLKRFRVRNFRNLDSLEVATETGSNESAQAIVLFGPNGTGKSSFAEAVSLAMFGSSTRLEQFLTDKDLPRATAASYLSNYLMPMGGTMKSDAAPSFTANDDIEKNFILTPGDDSKRQLEGVVLNQEDSIDFTRLNREELASRVLKGYSSLADRLADWLLQEEKRASESKLIFTRKHGLNSAIKLSSTAYDRLAQSLLSNQLRRPSPEFMDWLRFTGRLSGEDGTDANKLILDWTTQQSTAVPRLAETIAKLAAIGANSLQIAGPISEKLAEFDALANRSVLFRTHLASKISSLREQLDTAIDWMDRWRSWMASLPSSQPAPQGDTQQLVLEAEKLGKERVELEGRGKSLKERLDILDKTKGYLGTHWEKDHPDICPVCDSDVSERNGIANVISTIQMEVETTIQELRARHVEIQNRQKELDVKLKVTDSPSCPVSAEDQARLKIWLQPFLRGEEVLEECLRDAQRFGQLKSDLLRMKSLPDAPTVYTNTFQEAERIAGDFMELASEADKTLEAPQAIGEVKKAFEQRLEKVLREHLPSTLEKVWLEIALTLTTASWLLPARPTLKIDQRGKSLSVQAGEEGCYTRYLFNAAERHVLGLSWFFTYYLAKRRFEEAWILLDDPAQEMDQPSFRELVRFWETLLRVHQRRKRPLTLIAALHQEDRALDATRATNGRLYVLGWKKSQQDANAQTSVKKVVLLAPGFHPLKPEAIFG